MHFEGRLDTAASIQTEQEMKVLHNCEGHDIILDCEKLEYISSSGLRLFLALLKVAKSKGSKVAVAGMNDMKLVVTDNRKLDRSSHSSQIFVLTRHGENLAVC